MDNNLSVVGGVVIAALCGGAVGLERQRSGHAGGGAGAGLHFAGLRTFTMLGMLAGVCGWLWQIGFEIPAAVLLGGACVLVGAAYVGASRNDVDGTTEVAALVVLAAGFVAGIGRSALASGIVAATVLLLMEKTRLHDWVARVDDSEFRSGVRVAVMAAVVLPLLPAGPFGPGAGFKPRELWMVVLLITGLEFAGYVARRRIGHRYGYTLAGVLGGLISSTSVTLSYARLSKEQPESAVPLASGAIAANAVLFPRVVLTTAVLNPLLARDVAALFVAPFVVLLVALAATFHAAASESAHDEPGRNPMNVRGAIQLAGIYQVAIYALHFVSTTLGSSGLLVMGFLLGMADIDALSISVARQNGLADGVDQSVLPVVLVVGALGTTLFKLGIAAVAGRGAFRTRLVVALSALAVTLGVSVGLARGG